MHKQTEKRERKREEWNILSFGNAIYLYVYLYSIYPILFLYLSACHIYQLYHICYLSCFNVIYYLFSVLNSAPNYTTYNTMRHLLLSTINVKGEEKKLNEQTNKQTKAKKKPHPK